MVSLESAFNAEQEHDIIFAVAYTTEEMKRNFLDLCAPDLKLAPWRVYHSTNIDTVDIIIDRGIIIVVMKCLSNQKIMPVGEF